MSLLEIKDLKVRVTITRSEGYQPHCEPRRSAFDHGAERFRQEHAGAGAGAFVKPMSYRRGGFSFNGKDLLAMKAEDAACEGIFLAFQYPVEIPGIGNAYFLVRPERDPQIPRQDEMDAMDFLPLYKEKLKLLEMDEKLMNRSVNEGFSGGEKSATRFSRWPFFNPSSPFSTKLIPASTLTL